MSFFERIIEKGDVAHDAHPIGEDARFLRITEMAINILLLYLWICSGTVREQTINCLIWIGIWFCLRHCLGLP